MNNRYIIWIDQDSTIYDLSTPWYALHNKDYPDHNLKAEDIDGWDTSAQCRKNNCPADIYSYLTLPEVWSNGGIIDNSNIHIHRWLDIADLGIITTAANAMSMPYKMEWLKVNFPFIKNIVMVNTHLKHLLRGDILIDDGLHNLEHFQGVRILYNQPWNQLSKEKYIRAKGWTNVDKLVRRAILLLDKGYEHCQVERFIKLEQQTKEENEYR